MFGEQFIEHVCEHARNRVRKNAEFTRERSVIDMETVFVKMFNKWLAKPICEQLLNVLAEMLILHEDTASLI